MKRLKNLTCLRAGIEQSAACLHGHGGQSTIYDLSTWISPASRTVAFIWLRR